jgi:hypothetical protein
MSVQGKPLPPIPGRSLREMMFTMIKKPRLVPALRRLARLVIVHTVALSVKCKTDFVGNVVRNMLYKMTEKKINFGHEWAYVSMAYILNLAFSSARSLPILGRLGQK